MLFALLVMTAGSRSAGSPRSTLLWGYTLSFPFSHTGLTFYHGSGLIAVSASVILLLKAGHSKLHSLSGVEGRLTASPSQSTRIQRRVAPMLESKAGETPATIPTAQKHEQPPNISPPPLSCCAHQRASTRTAWVMALALRPTCASATFSIAVQSTSSSIERQVASLPNAFR